ncbi:hypothetical protein RB195_024243 [Necator americanus]
MVVCVVDDELAPRMKPNSSGEPSKFSYSYGYPFFFAALSFLPVQVCACLQSYLYFRYVRENDLGGYFVQDALQAYRMVVPKVLLATCLTNKNGSRGLPLVWDSSFPKREN